MDFFFLKKKLITSYVKVSLNKKFEIIFKYRIFTVNKFQRSSLFSLYYQTETKGKKLKIQIYKLIDQIKIQIILIREFLYQF